MSKLKTPVRYESALDELNIGVELSAEDTVRPVLSLPIFNLNPVSEGRPPIGKLLRCDNQGSLLRTNHSGWENYETIRTFIWEGTPERHITFSQTVQAVVIIYVDDDEAPEYYWTDSGYSAEYKLITLGIAVLLPFKGKEIYFKGEGDPMWGVTFDIVGFY